MKFGGTSVEDVAAFERLVHFVHFEYEHNGSSPVVVVSAMSRFTDALLESFTLASDHNVEDATRLVDTHLERHLVVAQSSCSGANKFLQTVETARSELASLFAEVSGEVLPLPMLQDLIVSYGERLSSNLLAAVLSDAGLPSHCVDARRCIITNAEHGRAEPVMEETQLRSRHELQPLIECEQIPVLGGFIAAAGDGTTTTLGRGGSDYTAALLGAALDAREVQIWTDVPGVMTADPVVIPEARTIPRLSYAEAAELAYFGAKVLHPKTIQPAVERNVPVRICNARNSTANSTMVCAQTEVSPRGVKAIAHKTGVTLVQITSARMLGAHGFLHAIFEIFNKHRTAIDVVTTSEVSVSLSLDDASSLPAIVNELRELGDVHIEEQRAIICVVGEGLRGTPGIAARVFGCLSDINISLISQGASRINLTFVVEEERAHETVARLHETFFADLRSWSERVSA